MLESVIYLSEDQHTIRKKLSSMGLVAFIADGSVLPRESGISQKTFKKLCEIPVTRYLPCIFLNFHIKE